VISVATLSRVVSVPWIEVGSNMVEILAKFLVNDVSSIAALLSVSWKAAIDEVNSALAAF